MKTNLLGIMRLSTCLMLLAGCSETPRTKEYYVKNKDELNKVLAKCEAVNKDGKVVQGTLKDNCDMARKAKVDIMTSLISK